MTHPTDSAFVAPPRSRAERRLPVHDVGRVFEHGLGPDGCDRLGAREAVVFEEDGLYHLFYDGAGPRGWLACLATSRDLIEWERHGPVLDFGESGSGDEATATAPWVVKEDGWWHMFYLGSPNATGAPDFVPSFPYMTFKARARRLAGPWEKQYDVRPFVPGAAPWCELTASPGYVIRHGGEFLQFISGSAALPAFDGHDAVTLPGGSIQRTIGIARTRDLDATWAVDPGPALPLEEQIENSSLHYDPDSGFWFLFTNHIGCDTDADGRLFDFTDAVWVYWSEDPNRWNPENKAVALDGATCTWAHRNIGMPAVIPVGDRLAMLYDAVPGDRIDHMRRDIGLAWIEPADLRRLAGLC